MTILAIEIPLFCRVLSSHTLNLDLLVNPKTKLRLCNLLYKNISQLFRWFFICSLLHGLISSLIFSSFSFFVPPTLEGLKPNELFTFNIVDRFEKNIRMSNMLRRSFEVSHAEIL